MADPQKQLLTLIRDFVTEKSQGERRIADLKRRIEELRTELDAENAQLEEVKRTKEATVQEFKGYEVELAMNDASIQALEARISQIQDAISSFGRNVENAKNEEAAARDQFISLMLKMNAKIRMFQEKISDACYSDSSQITADIDGSTKERNDVALSNLHNEVGKMNAHIEQARLEYCKEQKIHQQIKQEVIDCEEKISLIDGIRKTTQELQELTRQSAELEESCSSLGSELQKRCICPSCGKDNLEALEVLQDV